MSNPASNDFSAWIGLVPKQHSSGGKDRLGSVSKQGDRYLRSLFRAGALAVIRYAKIHGTRLDAGDDAAVEVLLAEEIAEPKPKNFKETLRFSPSEAAPSPPPPRLAPEVITALSQALLHHAAKAALVDVRTAGGIEILVE
jgi:hypothetical protein